MPAPRSGDQKGTKMDINVNKDGASLQIVLSGRLDTNTAPELDAALKENLEGVTGLVIDLARSSTCPLRACVCSLQRKRR